MDHDTRDVFPGAGDDAVATYEYPAGAGGRPSAAAVPEALPGAAIEVERAETGSRLWRRLSAAAVFAAVFVALFYFYRPSLLFSLTTTAGGDTGAHHYPAQYMIEELLPHFRLTGWAPGWYAGMPMLTFYFPFPFVLIALLNFVLPYQLAFKLVTALGVFLLPVTAYAFGRLLRLRPPFPLLAAAGALGFLLMESYSIYGGNILSTLAGEFGYSLSFALVFLFLGTLHRGLERERIDWLFAVNGLILMVLVLSHIVTTIALVIIAPGLLLLHRKWRAVAYMAAVFLLGFCLTAFWGMPFVDKMPWTAHVAWNQLTQFKDLVPIDLRPAAALGVVGMAYALARRDAKTLPLLWISVTMVAAFYALPDGRLWNARLLPFFYFSMFLWAAYGVAWLLRPFLVMVDDLLGLRPPAGRHIYAPVVAVIVAAVVITSSTTAAGWIRWNYSGYEGKDAWPAYKEINDYISSLPPGRVMVEHSDKIDKYGTPRAFEILPYWTGHPTIEGTLMEASFTAPFHFINQAELSVQPSNAIVGVDYPGRDTQRGITHLQLMNIPYLMTVSPEVTAEVNADPRADFLTKIDDISIFKISGTTGYVEVMKNRPLRLVTGDWRDSIVPWYKEESVLRVPIIWDRGEPALQEFDSITADSVTNPPVEPVQNPGEVVSEQLDNEKLTFETTAVGQPHWIKISYFPNWKVEGADGPYVASPSFMMVIPRQRVVTLTYGSTASNIVGQVLTGFGWLVVVGVVAFDLRSRRREGVV
ncbi:MAG: 6-pyruvoyl-tetrahydropterin synthase-related protein [Thermoleophilia bacterium]|nr:6-pyruvoyl-tetrahydropterin synthase-related protein [Thermoleophilia bacterium]